MNKYCIGNTVKKNEAYLHPVYLRLEANTKDRFVCPSLSTKTTKGIVNFKKINKPVEFTDKELAQFMTSPYIDLNEEIILNDIYNIYDIDDLVNHINDSVTKKILFHTVNRTINIWIYNNINDLLDNYKILYKIYKIINKHYWEKIKLNDDDFKKKTLIFIESYIKNYEDFNFDIGKNLYKFLRQK